MEGDARLGQIYYDTPRPLVTAPNVDANVVVVPERCVSLIPS